MSPTRLRATQGQEPPTAATVAVFWWLSVEPPPRRLERKVRKKVSGKVETEWRCDVPDPEVQLSPTQLPQALDTPLPLPACGLHVPWPLWTE